MSQNVFGNVIEKTIERSKKDHSTDDIFDAEGFRCCSICGERKEMWLEGMPFLTPRKVGIPCACRREALEEREKENKRRRMENWIEELVRRGVTDRKYLQHAFEGDDVRNSRVSEYCRYYADNWERMKESGTGILLYGPPGTGKTFYACCIVNRLINVKGVPALVTSFPLILNQPIERRNETIESAATFPLVVFDDLGAERNSQYAIEQVFHIVDTRSRSGLPTIFTSNLNINELKNTTSIDLQRIYDRVLGMCTIRMVVVGESRRAEGAEKAAAEERELFSAWRAEQMQIDSEKLEKT